MKRTTLHTKPAARDSISFEELYGEISRDWQQKASLLQARRWHHLKQLSKAGGNF